MVLEEELTTKQVAQRFGLSRRRIQQIARELGARQRKKGCRIRIPASRVALELSKLA
jgi:DNA-binding transcriptional regulator LsrR (DeoR family)